MTASTVLFMVIGKSESESELELISELGSESVFSAANWAVLSLIALAYYTDQNVRFK